MSFPSGMGNERDGPRRLVIANHPLAQYVFAERRAPALAARILNCKGWEKSSVRSQMLSTHELFPGDRRIISSTSRVENRRYCNLIMHLSASICFTNPAEHTRRICY